MNTSTERSTTPLYKVLNEERTQGEFTLCGDETDRYIRDGEKGKVLICFTNPNSINDYTQEQATANAQYTALAVNNLAVLGEALEHFVKISDQRKEHHSPYESAALIIAKEALNKIS